MKTRRLGGCALVLSLLGTSACTATSPRVVAVTFTGGFELGANDYGRPVPLYAAMLGVSPDTFRQAFSGVRPDPGHAPSVVEQTANKNALLSVLATHGVTNDQLDRVANYYRFDSTRGGSWPHRAASAEATVVDGKVVAVRITDAGVGYTQAPQVSIDGFPQASVTAQVAFTTSFETNGHIASVS